MKEETITVYSLFLFFYSVVETVMVVETAVCLAEMIVVQQSSGCSSY